MGVLGEGLTVIISGRVILLGVGVRVVGFVFVARLPKERGEAHDETLRAEFSVLIEQINCAIESDFEDRLGDRDEQNNQVKRGWSCSEA